MDKFKAMMVREIEGKPVPAVEEIADDILPAEPVLVEVAYSGVNYKDALALQGNRNKIIRSFPFIPGADLVGTVVESDGSPAVGTQVIATGWALGERHWGGFTQYERLKPEWVTPLPRDLTVAHAAALGTAGLTALLCVEAIEEAGIEPGDGEVLVTGSTGGVGSIAVILLATLGYKVAASTGRPDQVDFLTELGAGRTVPRSDLDRDHRPLEKETWSAVVDTVGGRTLATALASTRYGGVVAACGLAGGHELNTTVMPLILRGARLQGIDSVSYSAHRRPAAWARLSSLAPRNLLDHITMEVGLDGLLRASADLLGGKLRGRTRVRLA